MSLKEALLSFFKTSSQLAFTGIEQRSTQDANPSTMVTAPKLLDHTYFNRTGL
jgi:hypothetical protein